MLMLMKSGSYINCFEDTITLAANVNAARRVIYPGYLGPSPGDIAAFVILVTAGSAALAATETLDLDIQDQTGASVLTGAVAVTLDATTARNVRIPITFDNAVLQAMGGEEVFQLEWVYTAAMAANTAIAAVVAVWNRSGNPAFPAGISF